MEGTRFDDSLDPTTIICSVAIGLVLISYFAMLYSHVKRFYYPQYQKITVNLDLVLCTFAISNGIQYLFPETNTIQTVVKSLCKARFVSLNMQHLFLFFGPKHTVDIQVERAAILLEGHPPVSGLSWNPMRFLGWACWGSTIKADIMLLKQLIWRDWIYNWGILTVGYWKSVCYEYGAYDNADPWKHSDAYFTITEFILVICGVSSVNMGNHVLGKLIYPVKPTLWPRRMLMFVFWMFCMDFVQNYLGNVINKSWWDEYGSLVILLEHLPYIWLWHYLSMPHKDIALKELFKELESLEDFIAVGCVQSYKTYAMTQKPKPRKLSTSLQKQEGGDALLQNDGSE